ncbi:trypsin-like peptidase domain-containing protein [Kordiimonas gwangyangensis]|uniref:trypsin-like peptidase domain-containing protein n=1 Tax=Kordiimonas gwangyangensis TaxID=288022 RepID=UPI0012DF82B2|nr:trypsin-like peptidase domain-containing protein [Kordiimonas gwangyangensis]
MPAISEFSVKSLFIQMCFNGQPLATGSGFVVEKEGVNFLITNRHNVTGRRQDNGQPLSPTGGIPNEVIIMHNVHNRLGSWSPKTERLLDEEGQPLWFEHPTLEATADFVALELTELEDVAIYPYSLQDPGPDIFVGPADTVSVVGFPFGLRGGGSLAIWATGFQATEHFVDYADLPTFLIDCRSRPGQSGSAVIAHRSGGMVSMQDGSTVAFNGPVARFLGIYSGRINPESDLGIVWKASAILELLDDIEISD